MIQEAYCSFEVCKLLKEKGFTEDCRCGYSNTGIITWISSNNGSTKKIARPTHQMACAWLRGKGFHINACITYDTSEDADGNKCDEWTFWFFEILSSFSGRLIYTEETEEYSSFEEATEAALLYTLKNLI